MASRSVLWKLTACAAMIIGVVVLLDSRNAVEPFDPERWRAADRVARHGMLNSLERSYELVGMTRASIRELLGEPDALYMESLESELEVYATCSSVARTSPSFESEVRNEERLYVGFDARGVCDRAVYEIGPPPGAPFWERGLYQVLRLFA